MQVRRRLDRLHHAKGIALGKAVADGRQLKKDDVVQLVLCVVGDANGNYIVLSVAPLVRGCIQQIGGN